MANYSTLKSAIQAAIKQNGNNEITGTLLQQALLSIINSLGAGYQYMGVATPATSPGTPDYNVFYIAGIEGTYVNFNNLVVADEVAVLKYNGTWMKEDTGIQFVSVSQDGNSGHANIRVGGSSNLVASWTTSGIPRS